MKPSVDEQKDRVAAYLARREAIAAETREQLEQRSGASRLDPIEDVDPAVRRAAEDAFYAERGRERYVTSDGRTLFLTPDEIAQRRAARDRRRSKPRRREGALGEDHRRRQLTWAFNAAVVLLALALVFLIVR